MKEKGEGEGGDDGTESRRNMWKDVHTAGSQSKRIMDIACVAVQGHRLKGSLQVIP